MNRISRFKSFCLCPADCKINITCTYSGGGNRKSKRGRKNENWVHLWYTGNVTSFTVDWAGAQEQKRRSWEVGSWDPLSPHNMARL